MSRGSILSGPCVLGLAYVPSGPGGGLPTVGGGWKGDEEVCNFVEVASDGSSASIPLVVVRRAIGERSGDGPFACWRGS